MIGVGHSGSPLPRGATVAALAALLCRYSQKQLVLRPGEIASYNAMIIIRLLSPEPSQGLSGSRRRPGLWATFLASGVKAPSQGSSLIAALKRLRHPKSLPRKSGPPGYFAAGGSRPRYFSIDFGLAGSPRHVSYILPRFSVLPRERIIWRRRSPLARVRPPFSMNHS
jgi:hypothetical protein